MNRLAIERVAHEGIHAATARSGPLPANFSDLITRMLRRATFVDARAIRDMVDGQGISEIVDGPEPRMPWPAVWADFACSVDDRDAGAVLAGQTPGGMVVAYLIVAIAGRPPCLIGYAEWDEHLPIKGCRQDGRDLQVYQPVEVVEEGFARNTADIAISQLVGFFHLLRLLQCRNISSRPAPAALRPVVSERLSRRYGPAEGGYRMHTVTIRIGRERTVPLASVAAQNRDLPLHLVRGHFKHYSPDAPLFGRYAGWWWWAPQLRGSGRNGVVDKNYRIAADQPVEAGAAL